jgi:hypothetical protein
VLGRIDNWVAANIQHRAGASLHTETLGAVIDRMAAKWIAAQQALGMTAQVDPRTHYSWTGKPICSGAGWPNWPTGTRI